MTRRILAALVALFIAAAPVAAEDWRPDQPDRLAALDAAMAPHLSRYVEVSDAIIQDFTMMSDVYIFTGVGNAEAQMQARLDAARSLPVDVQAALTLAHDAIATLDAVVIVPCLEDYAAVLRTGWLAFGDAADNLTIGVMDEANRLLGTALFLLGPYSDLVHMQAIKDCGSEGAR